MNNTGPRPVRTGTLPATAARVLEALQSRGEPMGVGDLAEVLGAHPNTLREALAVLLERGLVSRRQRRGNGRGRPAWVYVADDLHREPDKRVREHAALAGALAAHLIAVSADPAREGRAAGQEWGRRLAVGRSGAGRDVVTEVLEELDFDPTPRGNALLLRSCPLLDVARAYPDVVCAVHEGMVDGIVETMGESADVSLAPFADPAGCVLRLQSRRG